MLLALLLLAAPPPPPEFAAKAAELEARARAHHNAREYVQAADAYVALSSLPGVDVDDALSRAHVDLEAAFSSTQETIHLCRALRLARGRLGHAAGDDEQKRQRRLFWEETVAEDLEQLAALGGEAVCPSGQARRVGLLVADSPSPAAAPSSPPEAKLAPMVDVVTSAERRLRARRAAGLTLTGVGVGLVGLMGAALAGYRIGYEQLDAASDKPDGFVYPDDQQAALGRVYADTKLLQGVAIGLGLAGGATLATGIGLLASQKRATRRMALLPSSVPRGGGVVLRLRF
jgi:hypothetical protein